MQAGIGHADYAHTLQCRHEDLKYRQIEIHQRYIDNARRTVDEKAEQLKSIATLSALLAGFSTVMLVEVSINANVSWILVAFYGTFTSMVIGLNALSMINCTFILVGILKYDCANPTHSIEEFWKLRCEDDWKRSFKAFTLGVPLLFVSLGLLGWIVFYEFLVTSILVSCVSVLTLFIYLNQIHKKRDPTAAEV